MAIKYIGVGAGLSVSANYTSIDAWDSYLNGLGAFSENETGRILWASSANELSAGGTLSGSSPGSFRIIVEAGDASGSAVGGSFNTHANKTTNALRYDSSYGACFAMGTNVDGFFPTDPNVTIRNLQFKKHKDATDGGKCVIDFSGTNGGRLLDSCIVEFQCTDGDAAAACQGVSAVNTLFLIASASSTNVHAIRMTGAGNDNSFTNCTFANVTAPSNIGVAFSADHTTILRNCAVVGFTSDTNGAAHLAVTWSATDESTGSSGFTGTGMQYNLVGATEFESLTLGTPDLRLKSTSVSCKDQGTDSAAPTLDIIGQTRS